MIRNRAALALVLACVTLSFGAPAHAQVASAVITGEVRGEGGEPIADVEVRVASEVSGNVRRGLTNQAGRYQVVNLTPDTPYTVTARSLSYAEVEHEGIRLEADERRRMDFTLRREALALDELIVTALADRRFDTSRQAPGLVLRRPQIQARPTIERSMMELAQLSPMAAQTRDEAGYSITGQPERHNAILIDGALFQDVFGSSPVGSLGARARAKPIPMEAIGEFRLDVAPFDSRSSGFTGGEFNAITRSGTNEWEGSAFGHFRNERFFGDLPLDGANMAPEHYDKRLLGMTLGGPLRRDRAHFFVAAEFEDRTEPPIGFSLGEHDPLAVRLAADSVGRLTRLLEERYRVDPGTAGEVPLSNPMSNVFSRVDVELSDRHALTLRHNYARAARDTTPGRAAAGAYELSSSGYRIESTNHALWGKFVSEWGRGHSNEVTVNVQHTREHAIPASTFPQVDVRIASNFDAARTVRDVRAGSRYFAHHDELDQTVVQISDAVTFARDDIITTLGLSADFFRFDHGLLPGARGYYRFDDLAGLEANRPSHYEVNGLLPGVEDPSVRFSVLQPAAFVQNVHTFQGGLVLRYGLRVEVPIFREDFVYSDDVKEEFDYERRRYDPNMPEELVLLGFMSGFSTDGLPSGMRLISPRMGFNYQSDGTYRTQVRGGWGVFTGRIPFVWLSNAYRYNGLRTALLACQGDDVPEFDPSAPLPLECAGGGGIDEAGERVVFGFHPDFRFPREIKITTAIDQELPWGLIAAVEGIVAQTNGRSRLGELNLHPSVSIADEAYLEVFGPRIRYGNATPTGYEPRRRTEGYSNVLMMLNDRHTAIAYALVFDLEKRMGSHLQLRASYSMARSDDRQSLLYPDHVMNFASSPVSLFPNLPGVATSTFDRPWKWTGSGRLQFPSTLGGGALSATYVGQAGMPYTYVYGNDVNADGYSGVGVPLDASNDMLYVPDPPSSISGPVQTRALFSRLVEMEPCLAEARGDFVRRNSCRGPPTHRLDLRFVQPLEIGRVQVELTGDLLNAANLLNSEWGRVWEVDPTVPVLDIIGRESPGPGFAYGRALLGYSGRVHVDSETGELEPRLPYNLVTPASQWQAQIGLRVSF